MAGRVTIQDIADALGVSRNTVSKAINNTGVLADSTRDKILQKAVEMGYKQFSYVSLTSNDNKNNDSSSQLSVILSPEVAEEVPSPTSYKTVALFTTMLLGNSHFSSTMLDKVQRELAQLGYSITMHRILSSDIKELRLPISFIKEKTDAIICIEIFDKAYSDMICDLDIPSLFIDWPADMFSESMKSDRLLMDNRSGICSFIQEMYHRGKTKIGYLGDYKHCTSFFERYMAFREGLSFVGLTYNEDYCLLGEEIKDPDAGPFKHYSDYLLDGLQKMSELPDVFICANDFIALDALQAFRKMGVSVPDDILLCGFDDSPESRVVTPPLTTIHIHSQIMGYSAVHLLLSRIKNPTMHYRTIYTETSLIYRESTGD